MQELLLPQMLKPAGYVCGAIGKWHLGDAPNLRPTQRGFDEFFGFLGGASHYFNASAPSKRYASHRTRLFDRCLHSGGSLLY